MAVPKKPANKSDKGGKDGKSAFQQALASAKGASSSWKTSRTIVPNVAEDLPDGTYLMHLTTAAMGSYKPKSGEMKGKLCPTVRFELTVASGDSKGKKINKRFNLAQSVGQEMISADLQILGYELADIEFEEIPSLIEEVAKEKSIYVSVKVGHNANDYLTIYINELIDPKQALTMIDDEGDEDSDDVEEDEEDYETSDDVEEAEEEEEDEENEDEEEEEKPAPKKKATPKKPAPKKKTSR